MMMYIKRNDHNWMTWKKLNSLFLLSFLHIPKMTCLLEWRKRMHLVSHKAKVRVQLFYGSGRIIIPVCPFHSSLTFSSALPFIHSVSKLLVRDDPRQRYCQYKYYSRRWTLLVNSYNSVFLLLFPVYSSLSIYISKTSPFPSNDCQ